MRIVHLADIHLVENGKSIWNTDTKSHFDKAISKIRLIENVDAIIVSGDLSDDGSMWTYKYIDESFKSLGIPTYCCPGNHDNLNVFMNGYKPSFYKIQESEVIQGWDFYFLNTAVKDMARGFLSDETLQKLEDRLSFSERPTCIVFHHPPIEPGGWLNRKLLENRIEFNVLINKYQNVKLVLFGHIHFHLTCLFNNILYSSASSIGFAFDKDLPKYEIKEGSEGFNLIDIVNDEIHINNIII